MPPERAVVVDLSGTSIDLQLAGVLRGFFTRTGATAKARAQQIIAEEITDRSGKLISSTDFELKIDGDLVYLEFFNDAGEYAVFQHEGTGIYGPKGRPIRPKNKPLLAWKDPDTGKWIFAKEVRGTPAKKFLTRAINFALEQEIRRINS